MMVLLIVVFMNCVIWCNLRGMGYKYMVCFFVEINFIKMYLKCFIWVYFF